MANKVYVTPEAAITWRASGGTNSLTLTSLGTLAGQQGALHDFGATTARSRLYEWRFWCKFATQPVLGQVLRIYIKTGDGTHRDNSDGATDTAVTAIGKLGNLRQVGTLIVDAEPVAPATVEFSCSGTVAIQSREAAPVIWNATVDDLSSTATDHGFDLVPVPDEIQ